ALELDLSKMGCYSFGMGFSVSTKELKVSKHLVAFTSVVISTSCGIPDFRGPKGVWTLQYEGKGVPGESLPFHRAMPSLTHIALVELEKAGFLPREARNEDCYSRQGTISAKKLPSTCFSAPKALYNYLKQDVEKYCNPRRYLTMISVALYMNICVHKDGLQLPISIEYEVLLARQFYFKYTTPDQTRYEMLRTITPLPTEHWPFINKGNGNDISCPSPHTPKAP
ncbi:hypothetical protein GIB67_028880, partial [Kingdonia uniflora]